jgi:hypothetical protein
VIFQESLQYLDVTRDLLPIPCHAWIRNLAGCEALHVRNPDVLFNQFVTPMGFALEGELSSAHRRYVNEGLLNVSKMKKLL